MTEVGPNIQSARRAVVGSTDAARNAGTNDATSATTVKTTAEAGSAIGSCGEI